MTTPTMQNADSMLGVPIPFVWDVEDLSSDATSQWIQFPSVATHATISWGNTGTGSPVGVREVHVCNHGDNDSSKYDLYSGVVITPVSGAGHVNLKISRKANYVRLFYDRTSGGTAAVFTNDGEVSGDTTITFF